MEDRYGIETGEGRTAGISRPRLATSVAIKMLRCLDLNLLRAPNRFGCDICPCKQVASKPRLRSKRASRCVPGDKRIDKKNRGSSKTLLKCSNFNISSEILFVFSSNQVIGNLGQSQKPACQLTRQYRKKKTRFYRCT